jgi:hypothetical protein
MNIGKLGIVALAVATLAVAAPSFAKGHDSNTLHKLGKAIQYPFNKGGQNLAVNAHRATGHKSVMHRRNGSKTYRSVITPSGHIYRKHRVGHHRRHH